MTEVIGAKPLLEARSIEVRYGQAIAIHDLSLHIFSGEVVALVGANGAGKTTTLRALSGVLPVTRGSIGFMGAPLASSPRAILKSGIAHCPEGRLVFREMTVEENLDVGGHIEPDRSVVKRRREELVEQFPRLAERRRQKAGTLSGGEQQMLAIARALMTKPSLLLLDEPTMGLAPIMAAEVSRIILKLRESGVAILLVEETAEIALSLADRVSLLDGGRVVLSGPAAELAGNDTMKRLYLGDQSVQTQGAKSWQI